MNRISLAYMKQDKRKSEKAELTGFSRAEMPMT